MRTTIKRDELLKIGLIYPVLVIVFTLGDSTFALAAAFAEPPDISNHEKSHLNVGFTGGSELAAEEASCTSEEGNIGSTSKNFSLGADPAERRVNLMKALMAEYGFTPEQASGPVGNFMRESGGEHLPPDVNEGGKVGPPAFSGGYGWAQWTDGRQTTFINFAVKQGYMESKNVNATDAANFAYLVQELNTSYKSSVIELKKQNTPESAAVSFEATYERAGVPALEERKKGARQAFNEYNKSSGSSSSASSSSSCTGTSTSVDFGEVTFPLKGSKKVVQNPEIFSNGDTNTGGHPYLAYDIMAAGGTKVQAFMSGKVSYLFNDTCNGDSVVIWNEEKKIAISYLDMQPGSLLPKMNQAVSVGEVIGEVGKGLVGCNGDHLHIDASIDKIRQPCSRSSCSTAVKKNFRPIGKELYKTYQALPDS